MRVVSKFRACETVNMNKNMLYVLLEVLDNSIVRFSRGTSMVPVQDIGCLKNPYALPVQTFPKLPSCFVYKTVRVVLGALYFRAENGWMARKFLICCSWEYPNKTTG